MRTKGIGPQGLGIKGNNGYHIGSPAKLAPLIAMAGKAVIGALAEKAVDKVTSPAKLKSACWDGYEAIGMKKKGGRKVPNCVPKK